MMLISTGCEIKSEYIGLKKENISFDEIIFNVEQPPEIEIYGDTSNIEIYNWDEKTVKFEIFKKIKRTYSSEKKLNADYEKFKIHTKQEGNKISFEYKYEGEEINTLDQCMDLKIYLPQKVKLLKLSLDLGKIKIHDDLSCDVLADLNMANMEVKKFEGMINFEGDMSNITISNGFIYTGSKVIVNMGNIDLKFDYQKGGEYQFNTKMGNIDLTIPKSSEINLESTGYMQKNEFLTGEYPTKFNVKTDMGRICIDKY